MRRPDTGLSSRAGRSAPVGEHLLVPASPADLDAALAALDTLDLSNLQIRWRELHGRNAPARLGPDLLRRGIAYRMQEQVSGGLSRPAQLRLKAHAHQARSTEKAGSTSAITSSVKPGTRFLREWQGEVHEVQAVDTGDFVYRGKAYRSLSVIACAITGTHQSGPRFFGLKQHQEKVGTKEAPHG